jgi:2-polyprenyl-3-methyl-5-hydroxy-6-metoxy-1,4-benzoquinol methylase
MTFRHRSYQKELLDEDGIPFPDIERNMKELDTINTLLGGHAITLSGFRSLLGNRQNITVCEIGCGGGDNLVAIANWCRKKGISINCIGIDLKPECIEVGKARPELSGISQWITSDYAAVSFDSKPDIIFSSLFCHHFTEEQLVAQLQWMQVNSNAGFFINDLHRHWLAYHSIAFLTNIFSSSYLVKNDAPISVTRGFLRSEWQEIIRAAGIAYASVQWRWAFRHLVTARHPHA